MAGPTDTRAHPAPSDEEEELYCYRHPDRETALRCSSCERPICVDCSIAAPVGVKCPECGRMPKSARARVPTRRLVPATLLGIVGAVVGGALWYQTGGGGFFMLIVAGLFGAGMGELVRWGAGGFRDPLVGRIAATCAVVAIVGPLVVYALGGGTSPIRLAFGIIAAAIAAGAAFNRAS